MLMLSRESLLKFPSSVDKGWILKDVCRVSKIHRTHTYLASYFKSLKPTLKCDSDYSTKLDE